jgi:uncharacterized protein YqfB (UPF0267 family)
MTSEREMADKMDKTGCMHSVLFEPDIAKEPEENLVTRRDESESTFKSGDRIIYQLYD